MYPVPCVTYVLGPLKGFSVISHEFLAKKFALRGFDCVLGAQLQRFFEPSGFGFLFQLSIAWLRFRP